MADYKSQNETINTATGDIIDNRDRSNFNEACDEAISASANLIVRRKAANIKEKKKKKKKKIEKKINCHSWFSDEG